MFTKDRPDRRKEQARIISEGRLPPGQALTMKFPVLHYGLVPEFSPAVREFRVWGEVEEEKHWTWEAFNELPHECKNGPALRHPLEQGRYLVGRCFGQSPG